MPQHTPATPSPTRAQPRHLRHVRPPLALMREINDRHSHNQDSAGRDIALDIYCHPNPLLREFFWLRLRFLTFLLKRFAHRRDTALDFGGGSGIFLPTLASGFDQATLIDLRTDQAHELCDALSLQNVNLVSTDIREFDFPAGAFDAIVAADVLEHFRELDLPLSKIHRWLRDDGLLYTSLPSENVWYRALRVVFRKQKPADHYHSAAQVEAALKAAGFRKRFGLYHPLGLPLFPLFRVSAWTKRSPSPSARPERAK